MNEYIKKIYNMMYSPIVTPYNLLENSKLDNYSYVKYYKANNLFIAEMECSIPNEGTKIFYYEFDSNDFLQAIYMENNGVKEKVFDRVAAIDEAKSEYYSSNVISEKAV